MIVIQLFSSIILFTAFNKYSLCYQICIYEQFHLIIETSVSKQWQCVGPFNRGDEGCL